MSGYPANPYSANPRPPKKSKTCLIVAIVFGVIGIPALCVCGGGATAIWFAAREAQETADDWQDSVEWLDDDTPMFDDAAEALEVDSYQVPDALWTSLESSDGRFRVMLPGNAAHSSNSTDTDVGPLELHIFSASIENDSAAFVVMYSDYPPQLLQQKSADDILDDSADGVTDGFSAGTRQIQTLQIDGHPGRGLSFIRDDQGQTTYCEWRMYLVGRRLYQIGLVGVDKPIASQDVEFIFDSFRLLSN